MKYGFHEYSRDNLQHANLLGLAYHVNVVNYTSIRKSNDHLGSIDYQLEDE